MRIREQLFIDGDWCDAENGAVFEVTNPASGAKVGTVPKAGRSEAATAIAAASAAFEEWRHIGVEERAAYLQKMHDALMDNRAALAEILTTEMGKPLAEAAGEIAFGAKFFRWFGEEARRIYGETVPSPFANSKIVLSKQPVGVVGAITPWNFPNSMIARKLAAAMAAGCTMVVKPASQTPYSALAFGDLAQSIDLPPGVLNVITGSAADIAAEFTENERVRKITFTGSTAVGKRLASHATANMKRVSMELGGNAPFIVFESADLDAAVRGLMISKFRNSGQTCVCANRVLVQSSVYDEFSAKFADAVAELQVADGMEPGSTQGPLIDEAGVQKVEQHIENAVDGGATVLAGGKRHNLGGTFFEPTILTETTPEMMVFREETFGPVAPLFRFETEDEAIRLANSTEYGLASYAYTQDLGQAWRISDRLDYGMVAINEGLISTEVAPFGGMKESGFGKEGSRHGLDDYLETKYSLFGGLGGAN